MTGSAHALAAGRLSRRAGRRCAPRHAAAAARAPRARARGARSTSPCARRRRRSGRAARGRAAPGAPRSTRPSGMSGSRVTSAASSEAVPSPQSYSSSGTDAARCAPIARPTLVSSALETTTGRPASRDDAERPADAAERLRLDHEDVGGAGLGHRERVIRPAHALVGRDRDAHVLRAEADLGELVDRRARLLDVLEVERRERVDGVLGLVDVPAAVRVDADAALGAERLAHGAHARDIRAPGSGRCSRP